jgi:15-cis-phytoene synthase
MTVQRLQLSYQHCQEVARGSSFYAGLRLLPKRKRMAMTAVYAFMRRCDDISDNEGLAVEKHRQFDEIRQQLDSSLEGVYLNDDVFLALSDAIRSFQIPVLYFHQAIEGTAMDLTQNRYNNFEELYRYCYHVASVVGLICVHIFGFRDPKAMEHAIDCGIGFQLTNVLRDIREDLGRQRIYLPLEDLERFHYTPHDLEHGVKDARFEALMAFQIDRAQTYYVRAQPLIGMIERDSRPAFVAMFESYSRLLHRIQRLGPEGLDRRARLNIVDRVWVILKALSSR